MTRKLGNPLVPLILLLGLSGLLTGQESSARLPQREAFQLYQQINESIEATTIASPELARAGAPLLENIRQAATALQSGSTREHVGVLYRLLLNARIYLDVADAVPKPNAFAEDIRRQLGQLRESVGRVEMHFRALLDAREKQLRNPDRDNLARYAQENRALGPPAPSEKRVVFLGDSITDGWPLNQYFPGKPYINRGISGQITGQMLGRTKADVIELQPSVLVVLAGTNDIARGVPQNVIQDNLSMIADLAEVYRIRPVFASILPVNDYHKEKAPHFERTQSRSPQTIDQLNLWIRQMCKKRGFVYLDYYSAMVDSNGMLQASMTDDGLHPNAEGYRAMAPLTQAAIDEALRAAAPQPQRRQKRLGIF